MSEISHDACLDSSSSARTHRGRERRPLMALAGVAGGALLVGLIMHAGPARLAGQLRALGPLLPLLLVLTGVRYFLQAAGWRLGVAPADRGPQRGYDAANPGRPGWVAFFNAVLVGEAAGYVAWGPMAREPVKAFFLNGVPARIALSAAVAERVVFVLMATALAVVAVGLLASRRWPLVGLAAATGVALGLGLATVYRLRRSRHAPRAERLASNLSGGDPCTPSRHPSAAAALGTPSTSLLAETPSPRSAPRATLDVARDLWECRPAALVGIVGLAMAQEAINVLETYLIFMWMGAAPTLTLAVVFEGLSRFVNAAGQFVPGRVGVYEAASALLANMLSLGAASGVSLALARRARSLIWTVPGVLLLVHRGYHRAVRGASPDEGAPVPMEVRA